MLLFTPEQFLAVFVNYNSAIWPIQIAAYLLGGVAVAILFFEPREGDRVIAGILAVMWMWTGVAYHGLWFSVINQAAYLFAALFIFQGCYLLYAGVYRRQIRFGLRPDLATWGGAAFMACAAIAYPLIGVATGHHYPEMPMFGVTPCCTARRCSGLSPSRYVAAVVSTNRLSTQNQRFHAVAQCVNASRLPRWSKNSRPGLLQMGPKFGGQTSTTQCYCQDMKTRAAS